MVLRRDFISCQKLSRLHLSFIFENDVFFIVVTVEVKVWVVYSSSCCTCLKCFGKVLKFRRIIQVDCCISPFKIMKFADSLVEIDIENGRIGRLASFLNEV